MLTGKVALVIGAAASNNMCQAIAREFALQGARVVVAGRHELAHERCFLTGQTLHVTGGLTLRRNPTQAEIAAAVTAAASPV